MVLFFILTVVSLTAYESSAYSTFAPQTVPPVTVTSQQEETTTAGNGNPLLRIRKYGQIEGLKVVRDWSGLTFDTFRGIPYAKPPVGNLRFEKPQNPDSWTGVLDAKHYGPPCYSTVATEPSEFPYSEDCLKLNVFTPKEKVGAGYPVMLWIHGGGFSVGDAIQYGFENILDAYVSKGIVFVSIHYRLNVLGFLTLNDDTVPGNYGLWDQSQALKWIHENIADFGGDPNRVTIFGQSAGGTSIGLLTLVKSSRDYIQGAIAMSGSPTNAQAIQEKGQNGASVRFVAATGCSDNDTQKVLACLKKMPIEKLRVVEASDPLIIASSAGLIAFGPNFDGDFLDKRVNELIAESPKIHLMVGVTAYEAGFFVTPRGLPVNLTETNTKKKLLDKAVGDLKRGVRFGQNAELLRKLVQFKYLDSHSLPLTEDNLLRIYTEGEKWSNTLQFLSDILFVTASLDYAVRMREAGSTVYFYQYDYYDDKSFSPNHRNKGAYHGDDMIAVFNSILSAPSTLTITGDTKIMVDKMTTLFGNFVKYGNPTPGPLEFRWKPMTDEKPLQYLLIKPELEMKDSFGEGNFQFWQTLVPALVEGDRKCGQKIDDIRNGLVELSS